MKIDNIEDLGKVIYVKRKNARRIRIKIQPNNALKVSVPFNLSYKIAENHILENKGLIKSKLEELNSRIVLFDEKSIFQTKWHKLSIEARNSQYIEYALIDHTLQISYPKARSVYDPQIQEFIKNAIIETLRVEAKQYLPPRINEIAQNNNLKFNKLFIKNIKTQWGSCSYKNNINLNLHIMRLPEHLSDYVMCHELCHIPHKNHGPQFWEMLSGIMEGDITKYRKELRNYSPQLF
ncbi:MAG: M48 family metallopeptidase [Bacteroidales bacterium]